MKTAYRIVGVMGGGSAGAADTERAYALGGQIARQGWVLLNGGRAAGIMAASARGAAEQGGITVGILPDETGAGASEHIQIPILTGMGSGRNIINVLSSHVVVACPGGPGTISEIALALKYGKTVILLNFDIGELFAEYRRRGRLLHAATADEAVMHIQSVFGDSPPGHAPR
ncbi:MAG TPA: DNA-binding protein [Desulfobacterales bacterium]